MVWTNNIAWNSQVRRDKADSCEMSYDSKNISPIFVLANTWLRLCAIPQSHASQNCAETSTRWFCKMMNQSWINLNNFSLKFQKQLNKVEQRRPLLTIAGLMSAKWYHINLHKFYLFWLRLTRQWILSIGNGAKLAVLNGYWNQLANRVHSQAFYVRLQMNDYSMCAVPFLSVVDKRNASLECPQIRYS